MKILQSCPPHFTLGNPKSHFQQYYSYIFVTIYVISQEPGGMYRLTAAGVQQQQRRRSTALSSKRQQCHGYRIVGHYGSLQINLLTRCQRLYTSCLHCSAFLATPSIFVLLTPAFGMHEASVYFTHLDFWGNSLPPPFPSFLSSIPSHPPPYK